MEAAFPHSVPPFGLEVPGVLKHIRLLIFDLDYLFSTAAGLKAGPCGKA